MEESLVLGIDAGSAHVVAVLAGLAEGEPQVIGVGVVPSAGIRRGIVVDLQATAGAIRQAVSEACLMAGRGGVMRAVIGISGPHIRSVVGSSQVLVHRPSVGVGPEEIRSALDGASAVEMPQGREVIHVLPRSYSLDGTDCMLDPQGLAGRTLCAQAHLITGEALPVQNYLRAAIAATLEVADYQLGLRAAGEAILTKVEREAGVLLLNLGAGTTGVAVYDRGFLYHVGVIPVGGEHITSDIATLLQTPISLAEQVKIEQGCAWVDLADDSSFELATPSGQQVREVTVRQLAEIIEPRVQEILQLAAQEVKRSGYTGLFPGGLVLTGGACRLRGLPEVAADCLGLQVRIGEPSDALAHGPEFSTAVGLAHWGTRLLRDEAAASAESVDQNRWSLLGQWLRGLLR